MLQQAVCYIGAKVQQFLKHIVGNGNKLYVGFGTGAFGTRTVSNAVGFAKKSAGRMIAHVVICKSAYRSAKNIINYAAVITSRKNLVIGSKINSCAVCKMLGLNKKQA